MKCFSILCNCLLSFVFICCDSKPSNKNLENYGNDTLSKLSIESGPGKEEYLKIINAYEDTMHRLNILDARIGNNAIKAYVDYQQIYWKDTLCAEYLFKAAEIADNLGNPQKAIALYQLCHDQYLQFPYRAECLFRIGNIYDYKLYDYTQAKDYYKDVINFFPKSEMVKQAEAALKNIGKSDMDLVKEFEKKNGIVREKKE